MKNKKLRKILIVQLTIIELVLVLLLIDNEQNSCLENENNNLLVYNYNVGTLLDAKNLKEEINVSTSIIDESKDENNNEEEEKDEKEEVVINETLEEVIEESYNEVVTVISNPDYTVAESLVEYAKSFVGYPYVYGGNSLTNGTDCSGFTKLIYAEYGINLPRVSYDQAYVGFEVPVSEIQIGDLVLSGYNGTTHHVAIYIGNGQIVHALNSNVGIVITDLYIMPITHVRRVL